MTLGEKLTVAVLGLTLLWSVVDATYLEHKRNRAKLRFVPKHNFERGGVWDSVVDVYNVGNRPVILESIRARLADGKVIVIPEIHARIGPSENWVTGFTGCRLADIISIEAQDTLKNIHKGKLVTPKKNIF
jgi:hypothetical protein